MLDEDLFLYSLSLFPLYSPSFFPSLSLFLFILSFHSVSAPISSPILIVSSMCLSYRLFIFFSSAILDSVPLCHLSSLSTCSMYSYDYKFIDSRSSALTSTTIIPPASRFADCRSRDRIGVTNLGNESSRGKSSEVKKQGGRKREKQRD